MLRALSTLTLLFTSNAILLSQENNYNFDHISANDGLCSNEVNCIMKDNLGFMWFGTYNGLTLYDGYDFQIYHNEPENPSSLYSSTILYGNTIQPDRFGNLWVGTRNGLNKINLQSRQVQRILIDTLNINSPIYSWIQCICIDRDDNIWIGTRGGGIYILKRDLNLELKTDKFSVTRYSKNNQGEMKITNDDIYSIYQDFDGDIWVGTDLGLNCFKYDINNKSFKLNNDCFPANLQRNRIIEIFQDNDNDLWFGIKDGYLHKYNKRLRNFEYFNDMSLVYTQAIAQDSLGYLWFGSSKNTGLVRYDRNSHQFLKLNNNPDPLSISNQLIQDIYIDEKNMMWIATYGSGVYVYDPHKYNFEQLNLNLEGNRNASGSFIYAILEDNNGNLWMVKRGKGVDVYNPKTGKIINYTHNPNDPNSLSNNMGLSIYQDRQGEIWIGTEWGLNKFIPSINGFKKYYRVADKPNDPTHISNNWINSMVQDKDGTYWIATFNGLNRLNTKTGLVEHFWLEPDAPNSGRSASIYNVYINKRETLWVSTFKGVLYVFDQLQNTFKRIYIFPDSTINFNYLVNNFLEDQSSNLWLGTRSGLIKLNKNKQVIGHYTKKDGLPANNINSMLNDKYGNLWIGTTGGLTKFNPDKNWIKNYGLTDGLPGMEFYENAACKTKGGLLYFGVGNGIVIVDPDKNIENKIAPPVQVVSYTLLRSGKKINNVFKLNDEIILTHSENDFMFEFLALNYTNPFKNQYAYKLDGLDDFWINCGVRRSVSYTNVPFGKYTFKVMGSNNEGVWNEEGTSIKVIILPPWWRTWWAYSVYLLIGIGLLYVLRRYDLKRQRLKHQLDLEHDHAEKLQAIDHMKSRFFANISHEFRTPLTLILGPVEQMLSGKFKGNLREQYQMILRNGRRLLRLINQLLDLSRLESGGMTLQVKEENIVELVRQYVQAFESLAKRKNIRLEFESEQGNIPVFVDRDKLEKILNNLLSNAFKFTAEGGKVEVMIIPPFPLIYKEGERGMGKGRSRSAPTTSEPPSSVTITVSDTGIGILEDRLDKIFDRFYQVDDSQKRSHEGTGIGLALTKELVELQHGHISVQSTVGKGSIFTIMLPLGKEHLSREEIIHDDAPAAAPGTIVEEVTPYSPASFADKPLKSKAKLPLILIVEDNADMRAYMRSYLVESYEVTEAVNGVEGWEEAIRQIPDLIISDVMMPEMDGLELCTRLKRDERTSHIPVILLTARVESADKVEGLETGADDYLLKPFVAGELLVRIKNLIIQREKLRAHYQQTFRFEMGKAGITSADQVFISKINTIIDRHLSEAEYSIERFTREVGFSHSQLTRKLEGLTGLTPSLFIRARRLWHAKILLDQKSGTVSQIAYDCGFNNLSYFSRSFRLQFGQLPSEYLRKIH